MRSDFRFFVQAGDFQSRSKANNATLEIPSLINTRQPWTFIRRLNVGSIDSFLSYAHSAAAMLLLVLPALQPDSPSEAPADEEADQ